MLNFDTYQLCAKDTAIYDNRMYPIASLMVESAELADLFIKPMLRGDPTALNREEIISEAGDVLWNLACVLSDSGISLSEVAEYNVDKLSRRVSEGTIMGSGDR